MNNSSLLFDEQALAVIKVPSPANGIPQEMECEIRQRHGRRFQVETSKPIATSTAVTIEHDDALFLGEVLSCENYGRCWQLEINIEQILTGLQSLMALRARLLSEGVPKAAGIGMVAAGMRR